MNRAIASRSVRRFVARPSAVIGALLALALVVLAIVAPIVSSKDPLVSDVEHGLSALGAPLPPSSDALLGTDPLGRDVWARIAMGARASLEIAVIATAIALVLGLAVGLAAGSAGGAVDNALMRLVDLVLAFPALLLAILLAALFRGAELGSSTAAVSITLGVVSWTAMARVIRTKTSVVMRGDMVLAARAIGASAWRIALAHVLPNIAGAVIVVATVGLAQNLLAESMLSYLGLGPRPPEPSWGRMLYEGRAYYRVAPHLVLVPGIAVLVAVAAFHLLAEGLRAALDPKEDR